MPPALRGSVRKNAAMPTGQAGSQERLGRKPIAEAGNIQDQGDHLGPAIQSAVNSNALNLVAKNSFHLKC